MRYNKRPPTYDYRLNKKIINILPLALVLHLMVGIYMYGSPKIFPHDENSIKEAIGSSVKNSGIVPSAMFGKEG